MKVAVISSQVFPIHPPFGLAGYGGLEVLAWQQAEGLIKRGHEVTLIAPDGSYLEGARMHHTGPPGMVSEQAAYGGQQEARLPDGRIIRKIDGYWPLLLQQDVCIQHVWQFWAYQLKIEGRLKIPCLAWLHAPVNTMFQKLPSVHKPCFVCISEDQKSHFEALFSPAKARVCHNGVDVNQFYKPLNLPRSDRFLFLARFSSIKGADIAIEACLKAGVGLDLIGDTQITNEPEYYEKCRRLAMQTSPNWDRNKGQQIRVLGGKTRGECVWYFSQAHCLLHPNQRFREPLGLAPVESQSCKTPVIAWRYGAMSETVVHGKTGWLANSVEEFDGLVKQAVHNITPEMRETCRENAKKFTVEKMCDRCCDLIEEAVNTGGW